MKNYAREAVSLSSADLSAIREGMKDYREGRFVEMPKTHAEFRKVVLGEDEKISGRSLRESIAGA